MHKLLFSLSLFLIVAQLFFMVLLNFYESQFLNMGLSLANHKVQQEFDQQYERLEKNNLFKETKELIQIIIPNVDAQLRSIREVVKEEFAQALEQHKNQEFSLSDYKKVNLDIQLLLTDMNYARSYCQSSIKKTLIGLRRDLNIVFGSNSLVLVLVLVFFSRKQTSRLGLKISWIVVLAVLLSTFLYFTSQNWLYTLLMNSYYGYIYVTFMFFNFLLLSDVVFNKGEFIMTLIFSDTSS